MATSTIFLPKPFRHRIHYCFAKQVSKEGQRCRFDWFYRSNTIRYNYNVFDRKHCIKSLKMEVNTVLWLFKWSYLFFSLDWTRSNLFWNVSVLKCISFFFFFRFSLTSSVPLIHSVTKPDLCLQSYAYLADGSISLVCPPSLFTIKAF